MLSSHDGTALVVITNQEGASQVRIFGPYDWSVGAGVSFPEPGVVTDYFIPGPVLSEDGNRLFFTLSTPRALRASGSTNGTRARRDPLHPFQVRWPPNAWSPPSTP